jgi:hypothetical protein
VSFVPTGAQDVVAVLAADFVQVFEKARAIKASIKRESKAMEHPLETGATVTDHRIIMPVGIELSLLLTSADYRAVYQQVRELFTRGELLTVQTRVDSFPSMLIEKMPHEESPDIFDGVALALSLKEAQFVQPQFSVLKVEKPKDTNTVQKGQQQPTETPPARKSSILSGVFK